jgi:hypothetical protein
MGDRSNWRPVRRGDRHDDDHDDHQHDEHDDHPAGDSARPVLGRLPLDVERGRQCVVAHFRRMRGREHHDLDDILDDKHDNDDEHHHGGARSLRPTAGADDHDPAAGSDANYHDLDHYRRSARLPMRLPVVVRLGRWNLHRHALRGRSPYDAPKLHDDHQFDDLYDADPLRLRYDDHEHDDGGSRLYRWLRLAGRPQLVRRVGVAA